MYGYPDNINSRADLENLLANGTYHAQALAHLQTLMDEQYGYDAAGVWSLVGGGGLARLGIGRAEAVEMGATDRVVPEPEYSGPTLEEAQAAKISEAAAACDAALTPYAVRFGVLERLTWNNQLAEAKALLADPTLTATSYPTIAGIIAETGETAANFAAAVVKNNDDWTAISAKVIGQRQKAVAEIKALTDPKDVMAYEIQIA